MERLNNLNGTTTGFLSFNQHPPKVIVTAEDEDFDDVTLQYWRDESKQWLRLHKVQDSQMQTTWWNIMEWVPVDSHMQTSSDHGRPTSVSEIQSKPNE